MNSEQSLSRRTSSEKDSSRILENEYLRVSVEDHGAQLCSLYNKETCTDLLWEGDPAFWKYHAPILFPLVGMVNNGTYRYMNKSYHVRQHGFAREMAFTCTEQTPVQVTHRLMQNEETEQLYPFDFTLEVTHTLSGRDLYVDWKVSNPSASEDLYFSIGAHPAFRVPVCEGEKKEDCYVLFHGRNSLEYILVDLSVTAADPAHVHTMRLDDGYLKLERHLFDIDTFIFENSQIEKVSLCGADRQPYITLSCPGFPYFGLWTKSDEAPFVCLEPWYGRLDDKGFTGELPEKTGIRRLDPGEIFTARYTITACPG